MSKKSKTSVFLDLNEGTSMIKIDGNGVEVAALIAAMLIKDEMIYRVFKAAVDVIERRKNIETNN